MKTLLITCLTLTCWGSTIESRAQEVDVNAILKNALNELEYRQWLEDARKEFPEQMQQMEKRASLLQKKFGPVDLRLRTIRFDGKDFLAAALTIPQAAYLGRIKPNVGGLADGSQDLLKVTCDVVYTAQDAPRRSNSGSTYVKFASYNLMGMPTQRWTNTVSRTGLRLTTQQPTFMTPVVLSDGTLVVVMNYKFVNPGILNNQIMKNRRSLKLLESHNLVPQLKTAINQILVLNSDIVEGQLVLKEPGKTLTPSRYLQVTVDKDGEVITKLEVTKSSDRQKLKDAHNNEGEFKDIIGVPVGAVLPSDD